MTEIMGTDISDIKTLAVTGLNYVTLAGAVFVKAPQLFNIWKNKTVVGEGGNDNRLELEWHMLYSLERLEGRTEIIDTTLN
jgi:hypothetical protein